MDKAQDAGYPEATPSVREIREWLAGTDPREMDILASSNQGQVIALPDELRGWVVKLAHGRGLLRRMRQSTLHREYRAYRRLREVTGFPRCAGLVDNRALILERIRGQSIRDASIHDPEAFFGRLLKSVETMHARGVAHGDLKRKSNIMVDHRGHPVILDLGASLIRRNGAFHPVNHRLFRLLRQTDLNAWIKHKHGRYDDIPAIDQKHLRRTPIERWLQAWRR